MECSTGVAPTPDALRVQQTLKVAFVDEFETVSARGEQRLNNSRDLDHDAPDDDVLRRADGGGGQHQLADSE